MSLELLGVLGARMSPDAPLCLPSIANCSDWHHTCPRRASPPQTMATPMDGMFTKASELMKDQAMMNGAQQSDPGIRGAPASCLASQRRAAGGGGGVSGHAARLRVLCCTSAVGGLHTPIRRFRIPRESQTRRLRTPTRSQTPRARWCRSR